MKSRTRILPVRSGPSGSGELGEAAAHLDRAIALTASRAERELLQAKLAACRPAAPA